MFDNVNLLICAGSADPGLDVIDRIAAALGKSMAELFAEDDIDVREPDDDEIARRALTPDDEYVDAQALLDALDESANRPSKRYSRRGRPPMQASPMQGPIRCAIVATRGVPSLPLPMKNASFAFFPLLPTTTHTNRPSVGYDTLASLLIGTRGYPMIEPQAAKHDRWGATRLKPRKGTLTRRMVTGEDGSHEPLWRAERRKGAW